MKVKFIRTIGKQDTLPRTANPASPEFPCKPDGSCFKEGDVADLKKEDVEKLAAFGLVEEVHEVKK